MYRLFTTSLRDFTLIEKLRERTTKTKGYELPSSQYFPYLLSINSTPDIFFRMMQKKCPNLLNDKFTMNWKITWNRVFDPSLTDEDYLAKLIQDVMSGPITIPYISKLLGDRYPDLEYTLYTNIRYDIVWIAATLFLSQRNTDSFFDEVNEYRKTDAPHNYPTEVSDILVSLFNFYVCSDDSNKYQHIISKYLNDDMILSKMILEGYTTVNCIQKLCSYPSIAPRNKDILLDVLASSSIYHPAMANDVAKKLELGHAITVAKYFHCLRTPPKERPNNYENLPIEIKNWFDGVEGGDDLSEGKDSLLYILDLTSGIYVRLSKYFREGTTLTQEMSEFLIDLLNKNRSNYRIVELLRYLVGIPLDTPSLRP